MWKIPHFLINVTFSFIYLINSHFNFICKIRIFVIQVWVKLWCHASKAWSKTWLWCTSGSSKGKQQMSTTAASWFSTTALSCLQPYSSSAKMMPCATWLSWRIASNTGGRGACLWIAGSGKSPSMRRTWSATQKSTAARWRNSWTRWSFLCERALEACLEEFTSQVLSFQDLF